MPVNDKPRRPNPFRTILLLLPLGLLVLNLVLTFGNGPRVSKVPYSFFLEQVQDGEVARVSVGQDIIRYQLKGMEGNAGQVQETTPIFDLELPKLLEANDVEFAATPPAGNRWFTTLLSWVIPPVIFVAIFQFFSRGGIGGGGPQGALSVTKNKAKVYVEGDDNKVTFNDVAGVEESNTKLCLQA